MDDIKTNKINLVILDFDGTIYNNQSKNFTIDIPIEHIIDAKKFFDELRYQTPISLTCTTEFILITGRPYSQKEAILYLLGLKGYHFQNSYFNTLDPQLKIEPNSFMIKYWEAKVSLINEIAQSGKFNSITVIDDDPIICSMLFTLGFTVYQAQIHPNLSLSFKSCRSHFSFEAFLQNVQEVIY